MDITEVRIKLMEDAGERLQAFCSITFDNSFVIRDLKIIDGTNGPFVAMPSRKLTAHCAECRSKNHLRAAYCNQCGARLKAERTLKDEDGRAKLYADIAHPINSSCREMIQERVIREFKLEVERSKLPGYVSSYDDFDHEDVVIHTASTPAPHRTQPAAARPPSPTGVEQKVIESPESQPRGPHHKTPAPAITPHTPASDHTPGTPHSGGPKRDGFGAGIL